MASSPRATLRPVFATATAAVLVAGFASAAVAQDTGESAAPQSGYHGPFLSWAGKSPPPTTAPAPAPAPAVASSDAADTTYVAPRRAAPRVEAAPEPASPPPAVAQSEPASYRAPPTPPAPEAAPPPAVAEPAPTPAPYMAPPAPVHAAAAVAAPTQSADAATPAGSPKTHVRFYSLHRAYGMTPDPIAMPVKRPMVLVGPADASAGHSQNGAGDDASDGGKAAPHDDGKGAGDPSDPSGDN
jgi:hypothetical protein